MRRVAFAIVWSLIGLAAGGCAGLGPRQQAMNAPLENPMFVPMSNPDYTWDQIVDVVDDYFEIEQEDRVRVVGDVLTIGRIETRPEVASTVFEPWRRDSIGAYQRVEATLQSLRRRGLVQVVPADGGFLIDVAVYKELEDLAQPENAVTGIANFRRYDESINRDDDPRSDPVRIQDRVPPPQRASGPVGPQPVELGWIPQGRDALLEQRILSQILERVPQAPCGPFGQSPR